MKHALSARYRPPAIPPGLVVALTVTFAVLTFSRGLTWVTSPDPDAVGEVLADTWFGLRTWGLILTGGAGVLLAALAARRHFAVWTGHALLASGYAGILLAVLSAALQAGTGWQALVTPLGGAIWHTFLNYRMKPLIRPPHVSEAAHGRRVAG